MNVLLGMSLIFIFGLIIARAAEKIRIPVITAYLLLGIVLGPYVLNYIPLKIIESSGIISNFTLSLIAFSIGANLTYGVMQQVGKQVVFISLLAATGAALSVFSAMAILGLPFYACMIFAAIAVPTAPAAILIEIREYKAKGRFTDVLMGVVALKDVWGLIAFSVVLMFARVIYHDQKIDFLHTATLPMLEIFGSFLLGGVIACVFNFFAKFIKKKNETLIFTLGLILFTAGFALHFKLSVLLACMVLAAMIVNYNKDSARFFEELKIIDWPLYLFFFVIAGANFDLNHLKIFSSLWVVYLIARIVGKLFGVYIGSISSSASKEVRDYLGVAQLPQAGIALGMALIAKSYFQEMGNTIFTVVAAAAIISEMIGPFFIRYALRQAKQIS
jgi:NhaP-type Na+/H+ or K+/H+ antiporter